MEMRYNGDEQKDCNFDLVHASGGAGKTWKRNTVEMIQCCFIFLQDLKIFVCVCLIFHLCRNETSIF